MRRPEVGLFEKAIIDVNKGRANKGKLLSFSSKPCGCVRDGSTTHFIRTL